MPQFDYAQVPQWCPSADMWQQWAAFYAGEPPRPTAWGPPAAAMPPPSPPHRRRRHRRSPSTSGRSEESPEVEAASRRDRRAGGDRRAPPLQAQTASTASAASSTASPAQSAGKRPRSPRLAPLGGSGRRSRENIVEDLRRLLAEAGGGGEALAFLAEAALALVDSPDVVVRDQVADLVEVIHNRDKYIASAAGKRANRLKAPPHE